jgi:hypothetical protein
VDPRAGRFENNVRYWWVNQNQTYEQETRGGYLWSPKRNANDRRNPFYEFMREVAPFRKRGPAESSAFDRIRCVGYHSKYAIVDGCDGRSYSRIHASKLVCIASKRVL